MRKPSTTMPSIGKVNYISFDQLAFEISDFDSLEFNKDGEFYFAKGILDYVTIINKQNDKFIYQVEKIEDKEKVLSIGENAKFSYIANVWATPVGMITNSKINFNLKSYPFLQDEVYLTTNEEYQIIFGTQGEHTLNLGTIAGRFDAQIQTSKLLTFHSAILGNTGSGKSTTIRQILRAILKQNTNNLHIHVFDIHGEYSEFVDRELNVLDDYSIPLESLELQDWINLVKPSDLVQLPILRMAILLGNALKQKKLNGIWLKVYIAYQAYYGIQSDPVAKRTKIVGILSGTGIDVNQYDSKYANLSPENEKKFVKSLEDKMEELQPDSLKDDQFLQKQINQSVYVVSSFDDLLTGLDFVFYLEESKGNSQARNYSATLETRIKEVQSRYGKLFSGLQIEKNNNPIIVYDVSQLDDDLLLFFVSYISKELFNYNKSKIISSRDVNVLLLEEAHRYVSKEKDTSQLFEIEIFKRIAREGRKFGIFLWLSSQRPSELSGTVLSQINNFLLHRIKNNVDLDYMSKTIPYITQNQLKRLSFLPTGVMYTVGELFPIPIEITVYPPDEKFDVTQTPPIKFNNSSN